MKQVRLLDRQNVAVDLLHIADLVANKEQAAPAHRVLRTRNDSAHRLGLPLPSGRVDTYVAHGDTPLLLEQAPLSDIAVGEALEIGAGAARDVQVRTVVEKTAISRAPITSLPRLPGVGHLRRAVQDDVRRIEITNSGDQDILFEARLQLPDRTQLIGAEPVPVLRNGRQVLPARIPAGGRTVMHYRTEHTVEDLSWLLACRGKNLGDVISDERLLALLDAIIPKVMADELLVRLGGPPTPVSVTQNRYVWVSACNLDYCSGWSFLWVDTHTGDALGGTATMDSSGVSLTMGSNSLGADNIPEPARQALRTWLAGLMAAPDSVEFTGGDGVTHTLDAAVFAP
jgi:hypothetical protein